jgi:Rrf2 family transcriptional regulator, nitric oxide-sensitive transcriptional repressor
LRLTNFTDYALRVLMYVGAKGEQNSTIDEIAEYYGISRNHLMKVVFRLGKLGYLSTSRGKGGGLRLGMDPAKLNIGKLVRQTEEDLSVVSCLPDGGGDCRIRSACVLRGALAEALDAFLGTLDQYTLADLLEPKRRLARLFAFDQAG